MNLSISYSRLRTGETIRRRPPIHIENAIPDQFCKETAMYPRSPEAGLYRIVKGYINQSGSVHDAFARAVPWNRAAYPVGEKEPGLQWNPKVWTRRPLRVGGRLVALTHPRQKNYFHWLFDVLPRIALLEAANTQWDALYVDQSHEFQRESWSRLGLSGDVIDASRFNSAHSAELVVPSAPSTSGVMPRWACDWLRSRLGSNLGPSNTGRRLYVSRAKVGTGMIDNEDSVRACLEKRDFTTVNCEDLPMKEQIALFSQAEVVLGPHGAGLSNVLFAPSNCTLIELFGAPHLNLCYWTLCTQLETPYAFLLAKGISGRGGTQRPDLGVDVGRLEALLDHLGIYGRERSH
jgi:hypothetical protein